MTDVGQIKDEWVTRVPERLIYVGNTPRPYGVNEEDLFAGDIHLAAVLANSLRMFVAYGHLVRDDEEYERIARKLEFYAIDYHSVLHDMIDWSNDPTHGMIITDEKGVWQSPAGEPGFDEYCAKTAQIDYWREQYIREALDWLRDRWGELWD